MQEVNVGYKPEIIMYETECELCEKEFDTLIKDRTICKKCAAEHYPEHDYGEDDC